MARFFIFLFCFLYSLPSYAQKIHLVYQFNETLLYEKDWLLELLSDFEVEEHRDGHFQTAIDNSIIVVSSGLK